MTKESREGNKKQTKKKEKKGKKKKCEGTFNLLSEKEKKKNNSKAVINGMLRLCIKPIKVKKIKRN